MGRYEYAVKFYLMIETNDGSYYIKVAQCYMVLGEKRKAIPYFYKALQSMKGDIDIRVTLSSLLIDEGKTNEAVTLLSPPKSPELQSATTPDQQKPWWCDGKVKVHLANIYYNEGKLEDFVDTIFLPILDTLNVEHANRKVMFFPMVLTYCLIKLCICYYFFYIYTFHFCSSAQYGFRSVFLHPTIVFYDNKYCNNICLEMTAGTLSII
uniref:Uncharacterized protein n=1 Tax=Arundo donax TaxID=35708 RepID=A0A0A9DW74_ARUDO